MRGRRVVAMLALAAAAAQLAGPGSASAGAPDEAGIAAIPCPARARHVNASHDGRSCTTLSPNLGERWSVVLNGPTSYPVIADGKVFVTTSHAGPGYGGWLYALDAATGATVWGPVPLAGTYFYFPLAYDAGRVFVNNFDGKVVAFSAKNGKQLWAKTTAYFSGEPVASDGTVYVHGSSSVWALSEADGHVEWTSPSLDGSGSELAVDPSGVYVQGGCTQFRLNLTGQIAWSNNDGCSGGGGGTAYVSDGRFFAENGAHVFKKLTGDEVGSFAGTPAFEGGTAFFAVGDALFAADAKSLKPRFTKDLPADVVAGPVIAGKVVYLGGSDGVLYAVSTSTGELFPPTPLRGVPGGGGQYSGAPSDINVGQGILVVPTGSRVTAYG